MTYDRNPSQGYVQKRSADRQWAYAQQAAQAAERASERVYLPAQDHPTYLISPEEFNWLLARLDEEPREMPRLRALLTAQPAWDDEDYQGDHDRLKGADDFEADPDPFREFSDNG